MTDYVAGLMFSADLKKVWLIQKKRPAWQAGKFNGIGGHIEPNETALQAMIREFGEETNVHTELQNWDSFCLLKGKDWSVTWFRCFKDVEATTVTDEPVYNCFVMDIVTGAVDAIPNLRWIVPMALDRTALGVVGCSQ